MCPANTSMMAFSSVPTITLSINKVFEHMILTYFYLLILERISWMAYRVLVWLCVDDGRRFLGHGFLRLVWLSPSKVRKKKTPQLIWHSKYIIRCLVDVICNEINILLEQWRHNDSLVLLLDSALAIAKVNGILKKTFCCDFCLFEI